MVKLSLRRTKPCVFPSQAIACAPVASSRCSGGDLTAFDDVDHARCTHEISSSRTELSRTLLELAADSAKVILVLVTDFVLSALCTAVVSAAGQLVFASAKTKHKLLAAFVD